MKKIFLSLIAIIFLILVARPSLIQAQAAEKSKFIQGLQTTAGATGAGYNIEKSPAQIIGKIVGNVLNPIWVGVASMLFLIYAGYKWMMSRGNEQDVELAKSIIKNTILALVVIFGAWAIVKLIIPIWEFVTTKQ